MSEQVDIAKRMFFLNKCSHFFLERSGEYERYRKFNISEATEKAWHREYEVQMVKQLRTTQIDNDSFVTVFLSIVDTIDLEEEYDILSAFIDGVSLFKADMDSMTATIVIEGLQRLRLRSARAVQLSNLINEFINMVEDSGITVSEHYKKSKLFFEPVTTEYITNRFEQIKRKVRGA